MFDKRGAYIMEKEIKELLKQISYEQKIELLNSLLALERQEKQDIQELAFDALAIGD